MDSAKSSRTCPQCGANVAETGFVCVGEATTTWMKIGGRLAQVATGLHEQKKARCLLCAATLKVSPAELLREVGC